MEKISKINDVLTVNLGTGKGYSVLDMVKAFEKASLMKCAKTAGDGKKVIQMAIENRKHFFV